MAVLWTLFDGGMNVGVELLARICLASRIPNSGSQSPAGSCFESLWLWLTFEAEPLAGIPSETLGIRQS